MITPKPTYQIQRRAFLQHGVLVLTASTCTRDLMTADIEPVLRVALITDLHHADKAPVGTRHYRETMAKLTEAAGQFEQERPHILVELGDLIDAANSVEVELQYLDTINRPLSAICDERHYVLGNHCVDTLTKQEFLSAVGQPKSWYSFERSGYRFVVLDSCFRSDGEPYQRKNFTWTDANLPTEELDWLQQDLKQGDKPVIVFAHQRLDVGNNHGVKNNAIVREILESSGRVRAVFQGHSHHNDLKDINGIHYCTLAAMIEGTGVDNNAYTMMNLSANGTIQIRGFRRQQSYDWPPTNVRS